MDLKVFLAIGVTLVFWASAFVGIRAGLEGYEPGHLALLRFITASSVMIVMGIARRVRLPDMRDVPVLFLHGFLGFTVYHACLNYGELTVSAASACFLINGIPVFTTILAVMFLKEKIRARGVVGIMVSVAGIALISFGEGQGFSFNLGALYVLVAAFSESVFMILQKPYLSKYTPTEYVTYTVCTGTVFLLVFAPGLFEAVVSAPRAATWAGIYLGVFPAAIAYVTWAYGLSKADVSKVVSTQFMLPGLTIVIGWFWLRELPGLVSFLGGLAALAGAAMITLPDGVVKKMTGRG